MINSPNFENEEGYKRGLENYKSLFLQSVFDKDAIYKIIGDRLYIEKKEIKDETVEQESSLETTINGELKRKIRFG